MAHTKAQRAVRGNRDSRSKRMGVKLYGGQVIKNGNIVLRQRGSKFHPGEGVLLAKDFTIMATRDGVVKFFKMRGKQYISVDAVGAPSRPKKTYGEKTATHKAAKTKLNPKTEEVEIVAPPTE